MLSSSKVKISQKFVWGLPGVCRLNPKSKKNYQNTKSTNQDKNFPKKIYLVSQCRGAKNSYGGYPTELVGSTQNHKKNIRTANLPIKTKIFPKKVCLVP
jgi:hypothetical protein